MRKAVELSTAFLFVFLFFVLAFLSFLSGLQTSYNSVFSQGLVDLELANDFAVVTAADDESRVNFRISVLEEYRFSKMCIRELLVINYISVVILDDQREFFGSGVFEFHLEDDVVIASALVLNRNLFFSQGSFLVIDATAVCLAGEGIANEDYYGRQCYCNGFYKFSVHTIVILYFTKWLTKIFAAAMC